MSVSVLILEDDDDKAIAIDRVVRSSASEARVVRVSDASAARLRLSQEVFTLLVLDIAVPPIRGRPVQDDAGLSLLDELELGRHLKMPMHIVGLTAHDSILKAVGSRFASRAVTLIRYDAAATDWEQALGARVWFMSRSDAGSAAETPSYGTDLAIVCALHDPELTAVLSNGWKWRPDRISGDPTIYYRAKFTAGTDQRSAVAAAACQMGMTASAVLAMKMIFQFRPRYIVMAGITAGRLGEVNGGDVIIANPTWDWGSGKIASAESGEDPVFSSSPGQLPLKPHAREICQFFASQADELGHIRRDWSTPPAWPLKLRVGPLASGSAVVEHAGTMAQIRGQHRKLIGVEMEGYAIHVAAEEAPEPQPTAIVAKGVVDFGVPGKDDELHAYAAYTSAQVVKRLAERYFWNALPDELLVRGQSAMRQPV
jgi:nucleoside phosphorylase/CheY-like chemotaxis protein